MSQRPPVPTFRVPRSDRPFRGGFAIAVGLHVLVFAAMLVEWQSAEDEYARAIGGFGSRGGGGGGGGAESVQYIKLPPLASAPRVERPRAPTPPPPPVETPQPELQPPDPILEETELPAPTLEAFRPPPPTTIGEGSGLGTTAGAGTGSGGGIGTGQGSGIGTGEGPGTGGEGGAVLAPEPRSVIYPFEEPPGEIKGAQFAIRFWVDERGRVTKVEIEPEITDRKFRQKLVERLRQWLFYPARTLSGDAVKGQLVVSYSP